MNLKVDRIISIATLVTALIAIILVLRRPAPIGAPQIPAAVAQQTQTADQPPASSTQQAQSAPFSGNATVTTPSAQNTVSQPAPPQSQTSGKPDAGVNSDQVSSAVAKMLGGGSVGLSNLSPDSNAGSGDPVI